MFSLWIYVFSVVLASLVDFNYIANQEDYTSTRGFAFGIVYFVVMLITRPLINILVQKFYFSLNSTFDRSKSYRNSSIQQNHNRTPTVNELNGPIQAVEKDIEKDSDGNGSHGGGFQQYEGGSTEEKEESFDDGVSNTSEMHDGEEAPAREDKLRNFNSGGPISDHPLPLSHFSSTQGQTLRFGTPSLQMNSPFEKGLVNLNKQFP